MKRYWFKEGRTHRDYGPAAVLEDKAPKRNTAIVFYRNALPHRENGSAQPSAQLSSWLVLYNRVHPSSRFHRRLNQLMRARIQ